MKPTRTFAERRKETDSNKNVVASVEFVLRAALHDSIETDFVHSIVEGLLPKRKAMEKRTPGTLELHSFSSARHWTTASGISCSSYAIRHLFVPRLARIHLGCDDADHVYE